MILMKWCIARSNTSFSGCTQEKSILVHASALEKPKLSVKQQPQHGLM